MAMRYKLYDSRSSTTSSHFSDPSSSMERTGNDSSSTLKPKSSSSKAIMKSKPLDVVQGSRSKSKAAAVAADHPNLTNLMKRLMDKKSTNNKTTGLMGAGGKKLFIPSDVLADDLKKTARKGTAFTALQRKLFGKGSADKKEVKALTEVKGNTRTLAMVLRSERELLSANKEQEMEISELKLLLQDKNREVEKLKDLCLKQREEIKSLKSAILFPDHAMNSPLQDQSSEQSQAKQLIPTLQRQVTSLTGQLQCLAQDLAQVKADKYAASARAFHQRHGSSPKTPRYGRDEPSDSLEFSSSDPTTPGSPDDLLLEDLNPCLTPYNVKMKSKEFEGDDVYATPRNESLQGKNKQTLDELEFSSRSKKLSKSSDCYKDSNRGSSMARTSRRSNESTGSYRMQMRHNPF